MEIVARVRRIAIRLPCDRYDAENRLVAMISASDVPTFAYDGLGRRVVEAAGGTTTRLLWCGEAICQARNASDTPMAYHYPQGELRGTQRLYYATDHLGSVREVRDLASGQTVAAFDYSPYGATTAQAGSLTPARGFAGMWRHANTGLYLTHYRAYSAQYGRWLNRDPIFEAGGVNLYGYVGNSPVRYTDPDGLNPLVVPFVVGGAVAGSLSSGITTFAVTGSYSDAMWSAVTGGLTGAVAGLSAASGATLVATMLTVVGDVGFGVAMGAVDVVGALTPPKECP